MPTSVISYSFAISFVDYLCGCPSRLADNLFVPSRQVDDYYSHALPLCMPSSSDGRFSNENFCHHCLFRQYGYHVRLLMFGVLAVPRAVGLNSDSYSMGVAAHLSPLPEARGVRRSFEVPNRAFAQFNRIFIFSCVISQHSTNMELYSSDVARRNEAEGIRHE